MDVIRVLGDCLGADRESDPAQVLPVDLECHVEVFYDQAGWIDRDVREHPRAVHAGEAGHDMGGVGPPPGLAVLQQALRKRVNPAPMGRYQPSYERQAGSAPVAVGAPCHRDDARVVEQRQRRMKIVRIEPGVGIEKEHDAEPLDKPEGSDALLQGTCLADVRGGLDDVDAMPKGQCDRVVGGCVRHDVHVLRRHESSNRREGVVDDHLFVVGSHEDREVGDGEDPAVAGG